MKDPLAETEQVLARLQTEQPHPETLDLDLLSTEEILQRMNDLDHTVAPAVRRALPQIAQAVEAIVERLEQGGRLLYFGAGTSGRLAILDAVECVPTFNAPPGMVRAFIAGGASALVYPVEGAEDDYYGGIKDVQEAGVNVRDVVVGISASGRAPYVLGALEEAKRRGAYTIGLACNRNTALRIADCVIEVETGPEVVLGSTRLRAGTAQKMVLNMLSTASMVRLGKVFGNLMVDLRATNLKLRARAIRLVRMATGCSETTARNVLRSCDWQVKKAILVLLAQISPLEAEMWLEQHRGHLRAALEAAGVDTRSLVIPHPSVRVEEDPSSGAEAEEDLLE